MRRSSSCPGQTPRGFSEAVTLPVRPPPPSPYPRLLCSTKYSLSFSVTHNLNAFFSKISSGLSHMIQTSRSSLIFPPHMSRSYVTDPKCKNRRHLFVSESLPSHVDNKPCQKRREFWDCSFWRKGGPHDYNMTRWPWKCNSLYTVDGWNHRL